MFAGPLLTPYACTTAGAGLGPPSDANCNAPQTTTWTYQSTDGTVKDLPDPSVRPADVATTTVGGKDVPFIVRLEKGVIDRGIYSIWTLDPEPPAGAAVGEPAPWTSTGWNGRLVYRFGGGCGTSYSQGSPLLAGGGFSADLVGKGYAVATNTLDTFQSNCNDVLSAEAAMTTREHFVEHYGVPVHTIGDGGSGGAIQQLLVAQNYPGILDAITPSQPFPDAITIAAGVTDCGLLQNYYRGDGSSLSPLEQMALSGHASPGTCSMWENLFLGGVNPTDGCDATLADQVYDPISRPDGVRCTLQDINVNVFGKDPATGFARRALDNTGVQYGLQGLRAGRLTMAQFLDANEKVGGYDIDGKIVPERTAIDEETAAIAYRTGRVTGAPTLRDVPIVLRNAYTDRIGDIHTRFHAFSIRDRLRSPDGADAPSLLLWSLAPTSTNPVAMLTGETGTGNEPIYLVDRWLDAVDQQDPSKPLAERVAAAKPADALNQCKPRDAATITGGRELYDQPGPCVDAFEVHGDPRTAAGEPLRADVLKCQLKPIDPADYAPATLTPEDRARLEAVFPKGVCDWSKPGVGQQPMAGTWHDYGSR